MGWKHCGGTFALLSFALLPAFAGCSGDDGDGGGNAVECSPEGLSCDGDTLIECVSGRRVDEQACAGLGLVCRTLPGASAPGCVASPCTEDALRCTEASLERCTAGSWVLEEDCGQSDRVCSADEGVPACVSVGCDEDALQCDGDLLLVCTGGLWVVQEDCAASGKICLQRLGGSPTCSDP